MLLPALNYSNSSPWHLGCSQTSRFNLSSCWNPTSLSHSFFPVPSYCQIHPTFFPTPGPLHLLFPMFELSLTFSIGLRFLWYISPTSSITHHICNSLFKSASMMITLVAPIILVIYTFSIISYSCSIFQMLSMHRCSRPGLYHFMRAGCWIFRNAVSQLMSYW